MSRARFAAATLMLNCALQAQAAAPLDAASYFRDPVLHDAALSPSGRHVAMLMTTERGRAMLASASVDTLQVAPVASFANADVSMAQWLSDKRLAIVLENVGIGNTGIGGPGVYAVDRDGTGMASVMETIPQVRAFAEMPRGWVQETCFTDGESRNGLGPDEMYVRSSYGNKVLLARMNTRTSNVREMPGPFDNVTPLQERDRTHSWLVDQAGELRVVYLLRAGRNRAYHVGADKIWTELKSIDTDADDTMRPLLYLNDKLYVRARNGHDEASIYRYDTTKQALQAEPLISAPGYDVDGRFITCGSRVTGFRMVSDTNTTVWFDQKMQAIQQQVDRVLPNTTNIVTRGVNSETAYVLVQSYSDRAPRVYYLFNSETGKLTQIGETNPGIQPRDMGARTWIRYPSANGFSVSGYLTLPAARADKKPLPMVLLLGDSPWERISPDGWSAQVQFLAAHGYAVLQPEPRGTYGYGDKYFKAGWKKWGTAVQDDIASGARWAAAQGIADPQRICIAGTGYGGYAALVALAKTPDLFKCAVSWSPMADPKLMAERRWKGMSDAPTATRMDRLVEADAPSLVAENVHYTGPVLLAYGEEDQAAPLSFVRKLAGIIKENNPASEVASYSQPERQLPLAANRIDFWQRAARFLAAQLGGLQ